jgi:hypothetical protein
MQTGTHVTRRSHIRSTAIVMIVGLGVGCATSFGQTHLSLPWHSLVNSASPWLVAAFAMGAVQRRAGPAVAAGTAVMVLELVGYYGTSHLRGFPVGSSILVFWAACAVVGGPIFGVGGWAWRRGPERYSPLGAALVPAAFVGEGLVAYGAYLHYTTSAVLFVAIGLVAVLVLGRRENRSVAFLGWLVIALGGAVVGEVVLHLIYNQSF